MTTTSPTTTVVSTQPDVAKLLADLKKLQEENETLKKTSPFFAVPPAIFHRFKDLFPELRVIVWKHAFKGAGPRMIQLVVRQDWDGYHASQHYSYPLNRLPGFFANKKSCEEALRQLTLYPEEVGGMRRFFDHDLDSIYISSITYVNSHISDHNNAKLTLAEPLAQEPDSILGNSNLSLWNQRFGTHATIISSGSYAYFRCSRN